MKAHIQVILILLVFIPLFSIGQVLQEGCETANFGVDADCYANGLQFGDDASMVSSSDDWFYNSSIYTGTGLGIIDTTGLVTIQNALSSGLNIAFPRGMAFPSNTVVNNIRYMDATYTRDFYGGNGVTDYTSFLTASKNGEDPDIWDTGSNNVTPKTDLIDCYGHMRRDGLTAAGPLWLFIGFSRVSNSGSSYFDAELYAQGIGYDSFNGFTSAGPDEGHKAWEFDAAGNITAIGDLVVSTVFSTNAPPVIELRIWVSRFDFNNTIPTTFNFGTQLDGNSAGSLFGYADIIPIDPNIGCGVSNGGITTAPPWGTLNTGGNYSTTYEDYQFAEFGINLTAFGIDPADLMNIDACDTPFASILYKSRASASFTASLKDFNGPIDFKDIPEVSVIAVADTLDCYEPTGILSVIDTMAGSYYEWQTPDGNIISNPYSSIIQVDQPGMYIAYGAPMQGCDQMASDTVYVPSNIISINPSIVSDTVWDCTSLTNLYALPNGYGYTWTGPSGYSSNLQDISVTETGMYILEVYDLFSGCSEFDSIYVLEYPCEHLNSTTLPPGVNTTVMLDTILPTFTVPADITIDCNADPTDLNLTGDVTDEADECDTTIGEATYTDVIIFTCEGEAIITRTWSLTDACGNVANAVQTITLDDSTAPTFTTPPDITIECDQNINDLNITGDIIDENDDCDNFIGEATYQDSISALNLCIGGHVIYRTWSLTDACGNNTSTVQVITLEDTTPPTFTVPSDVTIECDVDPNDLIFTGDVIDENDNCDPALGQATYSDNISINDPCIGAQIITRTWTLSDACGNTISLIQTITLEDTTPPTFMTPPNVTIECDVDPGDLTFTGDAFDENDNCDSSLGQATYSDVVVQDDPCVGAQIITRTWTLSDACGNVSTDIQTITLEDTTPPTFTVPADITIECDIDPNDLIFSGDVTDENDNCDSSLGQATYFDVVTQNDPCDGAQIISRKWTLRDKCGNVSSATQIITLEDTTPPTYTTPPDITIECKLYPGNLNISGDVIDENDNCDPYVGQATYSDVVSGSDPCDGSYIVTRTWTLSDDCGNNTTTVQVITFEDSTPPTFSVPADITLECDQDPNDLNITGDVNNENDNCTSHLGEATYTDNISINDPCIGATLIIRTWTLTDACGNNNTQVQTITLEDSTPPVFTVPADITIECDQDPNDLNITGDVIDENDNCDNNIGEATYTDIVMANLPCDGATVILRTWTLSDDCGNLSSAVQTIMLEDTTPPTFLVPADITIECDQDPDDLNITGDVTNEIDNCDNPVGEAIYTDNIVVNLPCDGATIITRTWSLTDDCGNTSTQVQTITLEDTNSPVFSAPADITIECDQDPDDLNITGDVFDENDNCDVTLGEATYTDQVFAGDLCSGNSYILRTWTLTDACGNDTSIVQTITFGDTTPPTFSTIPGHPTIECDSIVSVPVIGVDIFINDNCDSNLDVTYSETITPGGCANTFLLIRTWVATDDCGNQDSISQELYIEDTNDPVIISFPSDITIECSDTIPSSNLEVIDNCDSDIDVTYVDISFPGSCTNSYFIQRTFTWLDNCGNQNSYVQIITIEDPSNPTFTVPADITLECDQDPSDLNITGDVIDENDNCDTSTGEATYYDQINADNPCIGARVITRTWTLSDACGNDTSGVQIITLEDSTPPTFTVPNDITLQCDQDPNDLAFTGDVSDENDNCDSSIGEATYSDQTFPNDPCLGAFIIMRTWSLSDACGNTITDEQIITLEDTSSPVLIGVPNDITVECDAIPTAAIVAAADNCSSGLTVTYNEVIGAGCPYIITRTWDVIDNCGNTSSSSQNITVEDTTIPVLIDIPDDVILECSDCFQSFANGDFEEHPPIGGWAYLDASEVPGWSTSANSGMIEIQRSGSVNGVSSYSGDFHAELNSNAVGDFYQEFCTVPTTTLMISFAHHKRMQGSNTTDDIMGVYGGPDTSNLTLLGTFTATSTSGWTVHTVSFSVPVGQNISVFLFRAIQAAPNNNTLGNLIDDIRVVTLFNTTLPSAQDNCDADVQVSVSTQVINGACTDQMQMIRTWTAIDDCGNIARDSQLVSIGDFEAPVLYNVPSDITLECDNNIPAPPNVYASDNCSTDLIVDFDETSTSGCNYTITRTWTASDDCGNTITYVQVISIEDIIPPSFTVPSDITLECDVDPNDLNFTGDVTDEGDNCDASIGDATYNDVISPDDPCVGAMFITRTWTLTDECGNTISGVQTINLEDTTPPTFILPADITLNCDIDPDDLAFTGDVTDENDNCDASIGDATYTDVISPDDPCVGAMFITRTWMLSDDCGNNTSGVQVITFQDVISPTFTVPADITLECGADPNDLNIVGDVTDENDNCTPNIGQATFTDSISHDDPCIGGTIILRAWTLSDACGNMFTAVQTIIIEDSTPPTFTVPADITLDCDGDPNDINITGDVGDENDICFAGIGEASYSDDISYNDPCVGGTVVTRTWTLIDACGNTTSYDQIITLIDSTNPTFTAPADITIECGTDPNDLAFTGDVTDESDNCDDSIGDATYTDQINTNNQCFGTSIITRTWTLTDACGNSTSDVQIITVEDSSAPTFTVPDDITLACTDDPNNLIFTGEVTDENDNCDNSIGQATYSDFISIDDPCIGSWIVTRTWTLTDGCGNDSIGIQIITLLDTIAPTLTNIPADVTVDCNAVPGYPAVTASDICDADVNVVFNETIIEGVCLDYYFIIRTWSSTDHCSNTTSESQMISVQNCGATTTIEINTDSTVCENQWVTFTATVTNEYATPYYQWQYSYNGNNWTDIQGETDSTLTFQASFNDAGWYRVVVANDGTDIGLNSCNSISNKIPFNVIKVSTPIELQASICEGSSYSLGSQTYSLPGKYTHIYGDVNGCDSIITLYLDVYPDFNINLKASICEGESYMVGNSVYSTAGTYTDTLQSIWGCDSIVVIDLKVNPLSNLSLSESICEGEIFVVGNSIYTETGVYTDTLQNYFGCDSIVNLILTANPVQFTDLQYEICEGEFIMIGNSIYNSSGSYTDTLQSSASCDSIVSLELQVYPNNFAKYKLQICIGDSITIGNSVYTSTGIYLDTLSNVYGCDSIVSTDLKVADPLLSDMNAVICFGDSLQASNEYFTQSGTYYDTLTAVGGCDSIVTIDLIVLAELTTSISAEICETEFVQVGNEFYWHTGIYTTTLTSANGCDSTVILDLVMHQNKDTLISISACAGTIYTVGEENYDESGVYTTVISTIHGCDSTVILELELYPDVVNNVEATICDNEVYILNNITYNTSGVYTQILTAQGGCDSILNLNLTMLESFENFAEEIICEGDSLLIFNQYQNVSGTYTEQYTAVNGCDSVVTIDLILEPYIELSIEDEEICEGESIQLLVEGSTNVLWTPSYGLSCTDCPDPIASPGSTTTYTVSAESCLGLTVFTQVTVEVNYPSALEVSADISLLKGDSALLEAFVNDFSTEIIWTNLFGDTICSNCSEVLVEADYSTSYIATAITSEGCIDQAEVNLKVRDECAEGEILIPNFITPNGDGSNDRLEIKYSGVSQVGLLRIYNRWGELIFQTKDVDKDKWNGKFLDRELNPGVYVYYLEVYCLNNELFIRKGNVTIIK